MTWTDATNFILEVLKLNDEAILITSWITKTTFRSVALLHWESLLLTADSLLFKIAVFLQNPLELMMTTSIHIFKLVRFLISLLVAFLLPMIELSWWQNPYYIKWWDLVRKYRLLGVVRQYFCLPLVTKDFGVQNKLYFINAQPN